MRLTDLHDFVCVRAGQGEEHRTKRGIGRDLVRIARLRGFKVAEERSHVAVELVGGGGGGVIAVIIVVQAGDQHLGTQGGRQNIPNQGRVLEYTKSSLSFPGLSQ